MITAEVNIRVGDANKNGRVDVIVDAEVGGLRLPRIGPLDLDAHAAVNIVTGIVDNLRRQLAFLGDDYRPRPANEVTKAFVGDGGKLPDGKVA